ncbi:MAG: CHAT domain-containing protein [Cytophaga sp.]|uniref:CHAT domain-containing protein n=1 Tax=Cytophaga sp. TaxID=29535 RepID=UPI003F80A2D8
MLCRIISGIWILLFIQNACAQLSLPAERTALEQLTASGDYQAALKKAVSIKSYTEKKFGAQDPEHAKSLLDLAVVYYYLFDCPNSQLYIQSAKNIYAVKPGTQSYEYANTLQNQSYILLNCNETDKAEQATAQAIKIIQEHVKDSLLLLASLHSDLGYIQTLTGEITEAKKNYGISYELMQANGFENSEAFAFLLNNIASFYHDLSDYTQAKKYYEESLVRHKILFGNNSPEYATVLNNLAILNLDFGFYEDGGQNIFRAATIFKTVKGDRSAEYAKSLNDIGNVYDKEGDYKNAEYFYKKSLELKKQLGLEGNITYWNTQNNLALLYSRLGNYTAAISMMQLQLATVKKYKGEKYPEYGNYLNSMGTIYQASQEYANASDYFNQALNFYKTYYGTSDPNYSRILNNLGVISIKENNMQKALQYFNLSLQILEADTISNAIERADTYNNLGEVYSATGEFGKARAQFDKALAIYDAQIGRKHPDYWTTYSNIALLKYRSGNIREAIQDTRQVLDMNISMIYDNFTFLSEAEKLKYWNKTYDQFEFYNAVCVKQSEKNPELIGSMFDYSLATKSIVFNYTQHLKSKIIQKGDHELLGTYNTWEQKKQLLATYYNFSKQKIADDGIDIPALQEEVNTLEKNIAVRSADFKIAREIRNVHWKDVQVKLKDNEAAVQMIRMQVFNNTWTDSVVYAALILTRETTAGPVLVVLKNGNKLEGGYYKGFQNAVKFNQVTTEFYNAFWKEIDQHLQNKTTIYFSPDGVYNKINIAALKLPDGGYLMEKRTVQYVPMLRSLITSADTKAAGTEKAFLFGHPDYNYAIQPLADSLNFSQAQVNPEELRGYQLNELPQTKIEVEKIQSILKTGGIDAEIYTANKATETSIKSLKSPYVVHIATHGYFVKDYELEEETNTAVNYKENPLLRSGILLAGSNYTLNNQSYGNTLDDGILTAYEAMQLNLENTQLVILSACETGLGEQMNGEGVLGLQRSFMLAGADNMLMSLWQVNDEGTQLLMSSFYKYWIKDKNTAQAFRNAQLELMKTHPSPFYWAAFICIK